MNNIRTYLVQQLFRPGLVGLFINPFYLGRSAMYLNVRRLAPGITGRTLDVGCGSKPYIHLFKNVSSYEGMDMEQSGHKHRDSQIDIYYDGKTFPFPENSFDSLVFFEVLEHVFTPAEFMQQIRKVVKPGGHCLITVPFIWGEHEQPYDFARYSSFGLKHIFDAHGFEIIQHKKYLTDLRLIFLLVNSYVYSVFKKYLPGKLAWMFILPISFVNNILGLMAWFLPGNKDLYFGNIYVLKNVK